MQRSPWIALNFVITRTHAEPAPSQNVICPSFAFHPCGICAADVAAFSTGASEALGLELAPTAIKEAEQHLATSTEITPEQKKRIAYGFGDFFAFEDAKGGYDVAFDYTFFCALRCANI